MELVIELVGRGGQQSEIQRLSGDVIRIGRGFDNDFILHDPHACAHHIELSEDESGAICLKDLSSVNGTFNAAHEKVTNAVLNSGDEFYIGKSRFRVYRPDHVVPEAIRLSWVEKIANVASRPMLTGGLALFVFMLSFYMQYTSELAEFHIGRESLGAIGLLLLIALWPIAWTMFSRYRKHEARFLAQLSLTLVFVILATILEKTEEWLQFHYGVSAFLTGLLLVISFVMVLALIWSHLYLSVYSSIQKRWIYSFAITILLAGVAYIGHSIDSDRFNSRPEYTASIFPSSVSIYQTHTVDDFLKEADETFKAAARAARHEDN